VDIAELRRVVGADRKERHVGMEAASDFEEAVEVGRVAGVIDGMLAGAKDIASVAAVRVFEHACSPMARGDVGDFESALMVRVPPFEFHNLGEAEVGHEVEDVVRDD